jgi:hypothetical protein
MFDKKRNTPVTKKTNQILFAVGAIAIVLLLMLGVAVPAFPTTLTAVAAPASTPTPLPGDVIPLKPIADLTSLNATVSLEVNGMINGERTQGDLQAVLTTNDQGKSKITVSGSMLGDIVAEVGGALVGLFTPSEVDIYKMPDGTYFVINALFPLCIKADDPEDTAALEEMSPESLLTMLTGSDVARGKLVGEATLDGVPVKHYVLDGDAFLAAAQESSDPNLREFGEALWSAEDADLYVDAEGGYPVAFSGSYSGSYEPLGFEGDFDVQIELTGVNTNTPVDLPASCDRPIS